MNNRVLSPLLISFYILAIQAPATLADDPATRINLNNDGVRALNAEKFDAAIDKFKQALKLDPGYKLARDNLSIAFNNYALKKKDQPNEALKLLHLGAYLDPEDKAVLGNIKGMVELMGRKPDSFEDRVELGDQAMKAADFPGALLEYEAALSIKDDQAVREKLSHVVIPAQWKEIANTRTADAGSQSTIDSNDGQASEKGEDYWKQKVAALEKNGGPDLANALCGLADCYESDERYADSERLYKRALKILQSSNDSKSSDVVSTLLALADLYFTDLDRDKEAEALDRQALKLVLKSPRPDQVDLAQVQFRLGKLLVADYDQYGEAITLLKSALALVKQHPSELGEEWEIATSIALGNAYFDDDQYSQALPLFQSALSNTEKHADADTDDLAQRYKDVADCLNQLDRSDEALPLFEKSLALFQKSSNPDVDMSDLQDVQQSIADLKKDKSSFSSDAGTNSPMPTARSQAAAKTRESERIDQWLPWVFGLVCLILGVLWYRDRRESKDQANWPKPKD